MATQEAKAPHTISCPKCGKVLEGWGDKRLVELMFTETMGEHMKQCKRDTE